VDNGDISRAGGSTPQ